METQVIGWPLDSPLRHPLLPGHKVLLTSQGAWSCVSASEAMSWHLGGGSCLWLQGNQSRMLPSDHVRRGAPLQQGFILFIYFIIYLYIYILSTVQHWWPSYTHMYTFFFSHFMFHHNWLDRVPSATSFLSFFFFLSFCLFLGPSCGTWRFPG